MPDKIGRALRREIAERAGGKCEYCLTPEWLLFAGCEVDHIVSRKHGGLTVTSNLAFACARCNRAKGSDIGSTVRATGRYCRLFNPGIDCWDEHFGTEGSRLVPKTDVAEVTILILHLNNDERTAERVLLQRIGEFPSK